MEEEIITPEEEMFDYHKLRYILDKDGYVCHASLGGLVVCDLGECTEYNGEVPDGYETIEGWYDGELEKLNAWKIIDSNLIFDNSRYTELKKRCEKEEKDNSCVKHKDIYELQQQIEDIQYVNDSQYKKQTAAGNLIAIDDVKSVFPRIKITNIDCYSFDNIDLIVTKKNMLVNEATSKIIGDVEFTQNEDRSITINGTSSEEIEYNIAGTSNNTSSLLCFKKNKDYYLSSNNQQIKMYHYDGKDRTEIYNGTGGKIKFTDDDKLVTHITLVIPKGATYKNVTIYPQLELGTSGSKYEKYESNKLYFDFSGFLEKQLIYPSDDLFPSNDLFPKGTIINYIIIENGSIKINVNGKEEATNSSYISLFNGYNIVYTLQDTNMEMTYCINNLALEGTVTKNNNFKILDDGSIEAHNGKFSGVISGSSFIGSTNDSVSLTIGHEDDGYAALSNNALRLTNPDNDTLLTVTPAFWNENMKSIYMKTDANNVIFFRDGGVSLVSTKMIADEFVQNSLEAKKKNFEELLEGLSIIKDTNIYKYHYKTEDDENKKHIGLVIGENYNTPKEVISQSGDGIDTYAMISITWKAIQELNEIIENQRKEIDKLKEMIK